MEVLLAVTSGVLYASGIYLMLRRRLAQLVVGLIVVLAAWAGVPATPDAAIVIALIGFLGTVAYAT